jgi:hypothetical protein
VKPKNSIVTFFILVVAQSLVYAQCPDIDGVPTTFTARTTHFVICQHPNSTATPGYLSDAGTLAEESFSFITITQNFRLPPGTAVNPTDDAQRQNIVVESRRPKEDGYASTDASTPPIIRIDDNYEATEGWRSTGTVALRASIVHEMFHASQQAYVDPLTVWRPEIMNWIWEGTSSWIEDELPALDLVNTYLPAQDNYAELFTSLPETSLDQRAGNAAYGTMLFYKYLSEPGHNISIRQWFENLSALNLSAPDNAKALTALGDAIKLVTNNRNPFDIYGDFSAAVIAKTGPFGFSDDGAAQLPDAARVARSTQTDANAHDFVLGATPSVPHLSARYITVAQPVLLDKPSFMRAELTAHGPVWSPKAITLPIAANPYVLDMPASQGKRVVVSSFGVTMSAPQTTEVKELVISVANVSPAADKSLSAFESIITPNFMDVYTPNPTNGTTKTVQNLAVGNNYLNGDTINLQVTLSSAAIVNADFSGIDSTFGGRESNPVIVTLMTTASGMVYDISYMLSPNNTFNGSGTVTITAQDTQKIGTNTTTFTASIGFTLTQLTFTSSNFDPPQFPLTMPLLPLARGFPVQIFQR